MPSFFDRLTNRIELFRLESRYTKNRNRRSTFVSDSVYVDGEYLPASSQNTGSSYNSRSSRHASNTNVGNQGRRYNVDGFKDGPTGSTLGDRVLGTEGTAPGPYQAMNKHQMAEKKAKRGSVMFTNTAGEREEGGEERWGSNNPWNSHPRLEEDARETKIQREKEEMMEQHKRESRQSRRWSTAFTPATAEEKALKAERRRTMAANRRNWMGE